MKYGELKMIENPLKKVINTELPVVLAYKISKLITKVSDELNSIDQFRISLVKKYGENEEDGSIKVPQKNVDKFTKEFNELLESDIDEINPIKISLSVLVENNVKLSASDISLLEQTGFIENDLEE